VDNDYISNNKKTAPKKRMIGFIAFLITTIVWGFAFVPQKESMNYLGPITVNGLRCLLGAVCLIPVFLLIDRKKGKKISIFGTNDKTEIRMSLKAGLICGICLTAASTFQQIGVKDTSVGNAGFLSALYIVIVPLITLFFGKKVAWNGWVGVLTAFIGMFLLCFNLNDLSDFSMNKGDLFIIICSLFFSAHILAIDKFANNVDPLRLSCMQFIVCGVICTLIGVLFEKPTWDGIADAFGCVLYLGIGSCAVGYTLQIVGQKYVPAHIAPLLMGLECIFSLIAELIFYSEHKTFLQYLGCFLILVAVAIAQIDFSKTGKEKVSDGLALETKDSFK